MRTPAILTLIGVVCQAIMVLVETAWSGGILGFMASLPPPPNGGQGTVLAIFGAMTLVNLLSLIPLGFVLYGALRMLRAQGMGWATGGAILQIVWAAVHSSMILCTAYMLGCLLAPIELSIGLACGTMCLAVLSDHQARAAFFALERYPELLETSAARE